MAKFVMEDGNTISYDKLVRNMSNPETEYQTKVSPVLVTELRMIDTLKEISNNLTNTTLDNTCILQLIKGEKCDCKYDRDCHKCICRWYMDRD